MKNSTKLYLILSISLNYICFGILLYKGASFDKLLENPIYTLLFCLGFLTPFISALIVRLVYKEEFGGIIGLKTELITIKEPKAVLLILFFLIGHNLFIIISQQFDRINNIANLFVYFPAIFLLIGTQELGWRSIVNADYEKINGFWKGTMTSGLFWTVWFIPVVMLRNFIIIPNALAMFGALLVGYSFLSQMLYKKSGSIFLSMLFMALMFSMSAVVDFKQSIVLFIIMIIDAALASTVKNMELKSFF
ncbi:MAG: hypothetical protein AB7V48_00275 [Sedimentibacter sp.]